MADSANTGDRSDAFRIRVPDLDYWKENIPCQFSCPVHTDARGYVRAIAEHDFEQAYLIARGPNPLASICGRVCAHPCEMSCRRGKIDRPISIRALKRFVTSQYGSEANPPEKMFDYLKSKLGEQQCQSKESLRNLMDGKENSNRSVAIVGCGPAGLSCAHDLALLGFSTTIYEMESVPAGMLYVGVPEYRLPRDLIRSEVAMIESLGVDIKCDTEVGKDVTMDQLLKDHEAVVLSVGAKKSRGLPIPGVEGPGVLPGIDFLRDVALGRSVTLGKKIIVIGGGSVSYDVARSAWRKTAEGEESPVQYAFNDVSKVAARTARESEVHLCCLESYEEMLADPTDIREGEEEGIIRHNRVGPQEVIRDGDGKVTGVRFAPVTSLFDDNGRFSPKFDMDNTEIVECDTVLVSIGQVCDLSFIGDHHSVDCDERGYPKHDPASLMTSAAGIFVAGDLQTGPRLIIDAVASGKKAARGVYQHLTGSVPSEDSTELHAEIDEYSREPGFEAIPRVSIPAIHPHERGSIDREVEIGYAENDALREASRCLDCGVNTIFDGTRCILCGGCSDVCPQLCLKLVSLDNIEAVEEDQREAIRACLANADSENASVIIKDEDRCIRCGLCAERCPVSAVTMERFCFQETIKI